MCYTAHNWNIKFIHIFRVFPFSVVSAADKMTWYLLEAGIYIQNNCLRQLG